MSVGVSGIGVVSPAGVGVDPFIAAAHQAVSLASYDPRLSEAPVTIACGLADFAPSNFGIKRASLLDRYTQFALVAADEAMRQSGLDKSNSEDARIAVIIGSGAGGVSTMEEQTRNFVEDGVDGLSPMVLPAGLLNMAAGQVAIRYGTGGPCLAPCTACASGATAIGLGKRLLESGDVDVVIAGASEAPVSPMFTSSFAKMGALSRSERDPGEVSRPFDRLRDGFVIGEGAAVMVLERLSDIRARNGNPIAVLAGYGASADAFHVTKPDPSGAGAKRAMLAALKDADVAPSDVGYVNAHGTSTELNDKTEAAAIREVIGSGARVSSTKGVFGHALGAAAALEAVVAARAVADQEMPPTANLNEPDLACADLDMIVGSPRSGQVNAAMSNSFGFGGQNACLIFANN